MEQIQGQLINVGVTIVCGIITLLGALATYYLGVAVKKVKLQTQKIKNEDFRNLIDSSIDNVKELIYTNVVNAQEKIVPAIKESNADGRLTKQDGERILNLVKNNILQDLDSSTKALIEKEVGSLDRYLKKQIEVVLAQIKGRA